MRKDKSMGKKEFLRIILVFLLGGVLTGADCGNPANNDEGPKCSELELLYPNGGEQLTVGEAITIRWCIPSDWAYSQCRVMLTTNEGQTWEELNTVAIDVPTDTFTWTPSVSQISNMCYILVSDYDETPGVADASDSAFVVSQ